MIQYENVRDDLSVKFLVLNPLDPLTSAGNVTGALDATISDLDSVKIATFPADELFDFRAQRPIVTYQDGRLASLMQPELSLNLVTDIEGETFLYLSGQEPDYRWESVTADLLAVVQRFAVQEVFTFAAMPAAIPHTRPADMLMRSTQLKDGVKYVPGRAVHPGSLTDFFEYYAHQHEISVTNIRVRVPFYLAQLGEPFLAGALAAVRMIANLGGPKLPVGDLEQYGDRADLAYQELLANNPNLLEVISLLEQEYDGNPSEQAFATSTAELLQVPSSEEIGRAAEKFLAIHGRNPLAELIEPEIVPENDAQDGKQTKRRGTKIFGRDFSLRLAKRGEAENATDTVEKTASTTPVAELPQAAQTSSASQKTEKDEFLPRETIVPADTDPAVTERRPRRGKHHF